MRFQEVAQQKFVVFGAARSGVAAAKLLRRHKLDVVVADEKAVCAASAVEQELTDADISSMWGHRAADALEGCTVLVKSPGIPPENPIVQQARSRGIRIISEIELASAFVDPSTRIVAITGTNGKTTTTAWTAHLLQEAGLNAVLGGNIGDAWSNSVDVPRNRRADTVFVVENSSFQLEDLEDYHPHVAMLTNLAPDHLDRYPNYESYVAAKRNLLRNMGTGDYFVYNADNADSCNFATGSSVRQYRFTTEKESDKRPGAFLENDKMIIRDEAGRTYDLIPRRDLPLPGLHNLENALAASLAAFLAGAAVEGLRSGLKSFRGVEHRIEFCGEQNGVRYFNDSKATNLDSLEKALKSFTQPIVLIAGGRDKNSDYDTLKELVQKHVRHLVTLGEAAPLIEKSWSGLVASERATDMADAVQRAKQAATPGEVVLLSPACASYDMYSNFEERGRDFKARVREAIA